ncbi:NAD(P)-dependent oxidoreductase [Pasteurella testudinis]|uniref:NAD(P)-dependent oxidoreductase n=1 Tax=Pasteurella testudinis TaxID=761 RepID=UPI0040584AB9
MKIAIIGATGYVGNAVLNEALNRGHQVTALVRNIAKLPQHDNLSAVAADVYDSEALAQKLAGFDAVISAFNPGWENPQIGEQFTQGFSAITRAAKAAQVPYLIHVGGAGSLYIAPNLQLIDTPEFPREIYDGANAARHALTQIQQEQDLAWSFISPPVGLGEVEEKRSGQYRLGKDDVLMDGDAPAGISVADLAVAIVDEAEQQKHLRQRFTVAAA